MEVQNSQTAIVTPVLTKELVQAVLIDLFNSLADASNDAGLAVEYLQSITRGIKANPEKIAGFITRENLARLHEIEAKQARGIEPSFADLAAFVPGMPKMDFGLLGGMLENFLPK